MPIFQQILGALYKILLIQSSLPLQKMKVIDILSTSGFGLTLYKTEALMILKKLN